MLKVLYIDDEIERAMAYKEVWGDILQKISKNLNIEVVNNFDNNDLSKKRPHIVIADNVISSSTFNEIENVGASFIANNKKIFQDILYILFTGQSFSIKTLGSMYPNPDIIVPKETIKSKKYQSDFLIPQIKSLLKRYPINDVLFLDNSDKQSVKDYINEINSIIEQCTLNIVYLGEDPIDDVRLKRLSGGLSGTVVFIVDIVGVTRFKNVPCILRIGKKNDILSEVRNYNLFARIQMPHNLRVELLGFGSAGEFGGAMYAFALGDPTDTVTLTDVILKGTDTSNIVVTKDILSLLFSHDKIGWYNILRDSEENLEDYFSNADEYSIEKDSRRVANIQTTYAKLCQDRAFRINADNIVYCGVEYKLPRGLALQSNNLRLSKTICHGDLNTNNIIVSNDRKRMAVIDFEYTGIDHIYKDFISFEVSIRCYAEKGDLPINELIEKEKIRFENLKNASAECLGDGDDIVNIIRWSCIQKYSKEWHSDDWRKYIICLSFHTMKVAALPGWTREQFSRLIATLIASSISLN